MGNTFGRNTGDGGRQGVPHVALGEEGSDSDSSSNGSDDDRDEERRGQEGRGQEGHEQEGHGQEGRGQEGREHDLSGSDDSSDSDSSSSGSDDSGDEDELHGEPVVADPRRGRPSIGICESFMLLCCCCCYRKMSLAHQRQQRDVFSFSVNNAEELRPGQNGVTRTESGSKEANSFFRRHNVKFFLFLSAAFSSALLWALFYDTLGLVENNDSQRALDLPEGQLTNSSFSDYAALIGSMGWAIGKLWPLPTVTLSFSLIPVPPSNTSNSSVIMADQDPHSSDLIAFDVTKLDPDCTALVSQHGVEVNCTPDAYRSSGVVIGLTPTGIGASYLVEGKMAVKVVGTRFPWGLLNISRQIDEVITVVDRDQESTCVFHGGGGALSGFADQSVISEFEVTPSGCVDGDQCVVERAPSFLPALPRTPASADDMKDLLAQKRTLILPAGEQTLTTTVRCVFSLNPGDSGILSELPLLTDGTPCFQPSASGAGIVHTGQRPGTGWQTQLGNMFNIAPPANFTAFPEMHVLVRLAGGNVFPGGGEEVTFVVTSADQLSEQMNLNRTVALHSTGLAYLEVTFRVCPQSKYRAVSNVSIKVLPPLESDCALVSTAAPPVVSGFVGQQLSSTVPVTASPNCRDGDVAQVTSVSGAQGLGFFPELPQSKMSAQQLAAQLSSPHTVTLRYNGSSTVTVLVAANSPGRSANVSSITYARAIAYTCIFRGLNTPAAITSGSVVDQKYSGPVLGPDVLPVPRYPFPVELMVVFDGATVTAYPTNATKVSSNVITFLGQTYEKCLSFLQGNWTLIPNEQSVTVDLYANYAGCPGQHTIVTQDITFQPHPGSSACKFVGPEFPKNVSCLPGDKVDVGAVLTTTNCVSSDLVSVVAAEASVMRDLPWPVGQSPVSDMQESIEALQGICGGDPGEAGVMVTLSATTGQGEPSESTVTLVDEVIVASCDPPQVTAPQSTVSSGCAVNAECAVRLGDYFTFTPAEEEFPLMVRVELGAGVVIGTPLPSGMTQAGQSIVILDNTLADCQKTLKQPVPLTLGGASSNIKLSTSFQQAACQPIASTAVLTVTATPPAPSPCTVTAGAPPTKSVRPKGSTTVSMNILKTDQCQSGDTFVVSLNWDGVSGANPAWVGRTLTLADLEEIMTDTVNVVMGDDQTGRLTASIAVDGGSLLGPFTLAEFTVDCTPTLTITPQDFQSVCKPELPCTDSILAKWQLTTAQPDNIVDMVITLTDGHWIEAQSVSGVEETIIDDGQALRLVGTVSAVTAALEKDFTFQADSGTMNIAMQANFAGCPNATFAAQSTVTMQPFYSWLTVMREVGQSLLERLVVSPPESRPSQTTPALRAGLFARDHEGETAGSASDKNALRFQ